MDARIAAAIAAAAVQAPMSNGSTGVPVPGRLLLADGDGLCYYCAGNDETEPGLARRNLIDKLTSASNACGAEEVKIVTTARGSHKGYRYAVARAKPYQGQRDGGRRPKNWEYLREVLEIGRGDALPNGVGVELTSIAEADDLFGRYATHHPNCVIYTQDKDMRMVPGWHLDWLTHILFRLEPGTWEKAYNEKVWGRKWFWLQLLMGDAADNIPGLPWYVANDKQKRIGEKGAMDALAGAETDMQALIKCRALYESYYKERWLVEMLEQGILLWMRNDMQSSLLNVTAHGNPFAPLVTHTLYPAAREEILKRVAESLVHEPTEDHTSSADPHSDVGEAGQEVCAVSVADGSGSGSAGPRPLNGSSEADPAPGVQRPAGQGGEQLQEVRSPEPVGVPSWGRLLLAKA